MPRKSLNEIIEKELCQQDDAVPPAIFDNKSKSESNYPLILTPQQASQLLQVPLSTIYQWSSKGYLDNCSKKRGKHLRILRDKLVDEFFSASNWRST